jgi:hypothetical protein
MATIWNITADSVPVLDEWGWSDYWGVQEWILWHKLLKAKKGKVYADTLFKIYWNKQDIDANPYNWAKYDTDFRNYMEQEGLLSSVTNVVADVVSAGGSVVSSGAGAVTNIGEGIETTAKVTKYILPVLFIAVLVVVLLSLRKKIA